MEPPYLQRAKAFKSELFDSAGVEEKLLQKENEFMDLKKNMKLKVLQINRLKNSVTATNKYCHF